MGTHTAIDTTFDVQRDTPAGRDPDAASPTLKRYHRLLWDKLLPTGDRFSLVDTERGSYLHHRSARGEYWMTSDAVIPTFRGWSRFGLPEILREIPVEQIDAFETLSYTIGGMLLFPSWTGARHWSINQARGMLTKISDRMDLTLECIRRHYAGVESPMSMTLDHYGDFFALFGDLEQYAKFFLLDDLLQGDGSEVRFFLPFDHFTRPTATPVGVDEYEAYMAASIEFVRARNTRIEAWIANKSGHG